MQEIQECAVLTCDPGLRNRVPKILYRKLFGVSHFSNYNHKHVHAFTYMIRQYPHTILWKLYCLWAAEKFNNMLEIYIHRNYFQKHLGVLKADLFRVLGI